MKELEKAYEPSQHEEGMYAKWEQSGFFNPDVCVEKGVTKPDAPVFSMVLPPPNVTGTLHMGHATMLAIEDVATRFHRMKGFKTVWIPGTDHAGIATQSKVEKILQKEEGKSRFDLGREKFLEKVENFARDSHDTIVAQCKSMGASLDWSRECYTLDETRNKAVREVFVRMYNDGIIYRGYRVINWDPVGQTVISDDEVVHKDETTKFYYFKYGPFVIGTARPETKFGDKYVVMHPDDERYAEYKHGQKINLEWINGPIIATVIKDTAIDMAFGTGVMTITPWHSVVDFEISERHKLDKEQIIDSYGRLLPIADEFAGMSIMDARGKIVEKLKAKGLLVKEEEYSHSVATAERTGALIEPQIMNQWFVAVNKEFDHFGKKTTLKKMMQEAVREKGIAFIPERFENTYFHWIDNLRDWCISRQLWFGHRIPAWYKGEEVFVGVEAPSGEGWKQDDDTLDTWFSSGMWTFSALGWPEKTKDLENFHPTTLLETGYDILFFWVARMILMSTYVLNEIPFKQVYLHGLVRDAQGRKMSKSLGNVIIPETLITQYGTDATRLSLLLGISPGNDVKLSEEKVAGYRNFTNKLWNMSRFMLGNIEKPTKNPSVPTPKTAADAWILSRMHSFVIPEVTKRLENYDISGAGELLREFTWNEVADWYLEMSKIEKGNGEILNYLLHTLLTLWHPFMPYVTEAIFGAMHEGEFLMVQQWPKAESIADKKAEEKIECVQEVVTMIRNLRAEFGMEPKVVVPAVIKGNYGDLEDSALYITALSKTTLTFEKSADALHVVLEKSDDMKEKEKERNQKEIEKLTPYIASLEKKLGNEAFTAKASPEVVAQEREKLATAKLKLETLLKGG